MFFQNTVLLPEEETVPVKSEASAAAAAAVEMAIDTLLDLQSEVSILQQVFKSNSFNYLFSYLI